MRDSESTRPLLCDSALLPPLSAFSNKYFDDDDPNVREKIQAFGKLPLYSVTRADLGLLDVPPSQRSSRPRSSVEINCSALIPKNGKIISLLKRSRRSGMAVPQIDRCWR